MKMMKNLTGRPSGCRRHAEFKPVPRPSANLCRVVPPIRASFTNTLTGIRENNGSDRWHHNRMTFEVSECPVTSGSENAYGNAPTRVNTYPEV